MMSLALSAMSWSALLFVTLSSTWIIWSGVRQRMKKKLLTDLPQAELMPIVQPQGRRTVWISSLVLVLLLGLAGGYGIRDHQLLTNSRMYFGVEVLSQQSDRRYQVHIPDYKQDWDWEFCHPQKMPGPLIDIKFEQRFGCKAVNGVGFVSIHKENRNAELPNGRTSTAATATAPRLEAGR
jgi:hypothetical protein